jgi:RNA polymerase sigma-70 factor (ECF subfamily)
MPGRPDDGLTRYLAALGRGEAVAGPEALLFAELRAIAEAYLRGARAGVTLQPTVLVNEAYLKIFDTSRTDWTDRRHFFAVAARAMRQILVDHARAYQVRKGAGHERLTLSDCAAIDPADAADVLDLDELLTELATEDERAARLVELRFFAGLEMQEVSEALGISLSTAEREWRMARAWLGRRLRRVEEA